jgi:outer membrane immunogenic protein
MRHPLAPNTTALSQITSGLIASTVALVALAASTAADAADMPVKAVRAPIPVYTWTGFYVGINGGYGWRGDQNITFTPNDPASFGFTCGGGVGGTCALPTSSKLNGGFGRPAGRLQLAVRDILPRRH